MLPQILAAVLTVTLFLFSIDLLGAAFSRLGGGVSGLILEAVANPFISLFIGILLTAIIQSSSTTTAMVVAFVASGSLAFSTAIPMVMGANIGTTLTNMLVALGFIARKGEFRKAFATGGIHGLYNIFLVLLLFPLEYRYHILSRTALWFADILPNAQGKATKLLGLETYLVDWSTSFILSIFDSNVLPLVISLGLLFGSIKLMTKISSGLLSKAQRKYYQYVFDNTFKSFSWGVLLTGAVQSSTMTTTLLVPLVATKKVSLRSAFPFIMGANIGTTVTALLAALFKSEAAVSIALVHLFFNLMGVLIFLPFKAVREFALQIANDMGILAQKYRMSGFIYIILIFFLLPFTLIYMNKDEKKADTKDKPVIEKTVEESHIQSTLPQYTYHNITPNEPGH